MVELWFWVLTLAPLDLVVHFVEGLTLEIRYQDQGLTEGQKRGGVAFFFFFLFFCGGEEGRCTASDATSVHVALRRTTLGVAHKDGVVVVTARRARKRTSLGLL